MTQSMTEMNDRNTITKDKIHTTVEFRMRHTRIKKIQKIPYKIPCLIPDITIFKVHSDSSYTNDDDNAFHQIVTVNLGYERTRQVKIIQERL